MRSVLDILGWGALDIHEDFQRWFHYEAESQKTDHILQVIKNILKKTSLSMMPYSISVDMPK